MLLFLTIHDANLIVNNTYVLLEENYSIMSQFRGTLEKCCNMEATFRPTDRPFQVATIGRVTSTLHFSAKGHQGQ